MSEKTELERMERIARRGEALLKDADGTAALMATDRAQDEMDERYGRATGHWAELTHYHDAEGVLESLRLRIPHHNVLLPIAEETTTRLARRPGGVPPKYPQIVYYGLHFRMVSLFPYESLLGVLKYLVTNPDKYVAIHGIKSSERVAFRPVEACLSAERVAAFSKIHTAVASAWGYNLTHDILAAIYAVARMTCRIADGTVVPTPWMLRDAEITPRAWDRLAATERNLREANTYAVAASDGRFNANIANTARTDFERIVVVPG